MRVADWENSYTQIKIEMIQMPRKRYVHPSLTFGPSLCLKDHLNACMLTVDYSSSKYPSLIKSSPIPIYAANTMNSVKRTEEVPLNLLEVSRIPKRCLGKCLAVIGSRV